MLLQTLPSRVASNALFADIEQKLQAGRGAIEMLSLQKIIVS